MLKAGVIPYIIRNGVFEMRFFVPSNPLYGGTRPQIAKGMIDPGESPMVAALREGYEEVGLVKENIHRLYHAGLKHVVTTVSEYDIDLYVAKVKDIDNFVEPHFETGQVLWMTACQFDQFGRKNQRQMVQEVVESINDQNLREITEF